MAFLKSSHICPSKLDLLGQIFENGRKMADGRLLFQALLLLQYRFASDTSWSETGDRYLLKFFRDYLFHQVIITPTGTPWIDLAHVVLTLNKVIHI